MLFIGKPHLLPLRHTRFPLPTWRSNNCNGTDPHTRRPRGRLRCGPAPPGHDSSAVGGSRSANTALCGCTMAPLRCAIHYMPAIPITLPLGSGSQYVRVSGRNPACGRSRHRPVVAEAVGDEWQRIAGGGCR